MFLLIICVNQFASNNQCQSLYVNLLVQITQIPVNFPYNIKNKTEVLYLGLFKWRGEKKAILKKGESPFFLIFFCSPSEKKGGFFLHPLSPPLRPGYCPTKWNNLLTSLVERSFDLKIGTTFYPKILNNLLPMQSIWTLMGLIHVAHVIVTLSSQNLPIKNLTYY